MTQEKYAVTNQPNAEMKCYNNVVQTHYIMPSLNIHHYYEKLIPVNCLYDSGISIGNLPDL